MAAVTEYPKGSESDAAVDFCVEELLSVVSEEDLAGIGDLTTVVPSHQGSVDAAMGYEARLPVHDRSIGLEEAPDQNQVTSTTLHHASGAPDALQPSAAGYSSESAAPGGADTAPHAGQSSQGSEGAPADAPPITAAGAPPASSQAAAPARLVHREPHEFLPAFVSKANKRLNARVLQLDKQVAGTKRDAMRTAERADAMAAHMRLLQVEVAFTEARLDGQQRELDSEQHLERLGFHEMVRRLPLF